MATTHKDLPDECWELILNKLHHQHRSLLEAPSLTCKRFLSITNALRTHLTIVVPALFLALPTLFDRFPNLTSISACFFCGVYLRRLVTVIATSNLNLQTLDFTGTDGLPLESWRLLGSCMNNIRVLRCMSLRTLTDNELAVIADSMPCLEDLNISYPLGDFGSDDSDHELQDRSLGDVCVTDSGIEVLSSKLKSLRKIDVSGNEFLTDKSLIALSTNCVYLTDIVAHNCELVTSEGIEFVMRNSSNLSLLSIDGIQFGSLDDFSICCARKLSTLEIHDSVVPDGYLRLLAKADIPLKSFTLSDCIVTFSGISSVLKKYSSLESLYLYGIDVLTDEKMSDLSQYLSALVVIGLDRCNNLTELTFFKLARNCPLLKDISMVGMNLGGGGDGATDIVQNPRMKSLNLANNLNLSDECLAKLASVCPNLEVLLVPSCNRITENGIAEFLKSCSKVRSLRIDECGLIKSIGNGFELSQLDFLGATRSGIDDDGLVVIANRCRELRILNLEGCLEVTTVGLNEILTNCEKLRKINLTGCLHVRPETIDWMVFSRPSLREIILSEASLPSESQRKLFLRHGCDVLSEEAGLEC